MPALKTTKTMPAVFMATVAKSIPKMEDILRRLQPVPIDWVNEEHSAKSNENRLEPLECYSYSTLLESCHQALVWTPGLNNAFVAMLASCASVMLVGDQL